MVHDATVFAGRYVACLVTQLKVLKDCDTFLSCEVRKVKLPLLQELNGVIEYGIHDHI